VKTTKRTAIASELDVLEATRERAECRAEPLEEELSDLLRTALESKAPRPTQKQRQTVSRAALRSKGDGGGRQRLAGRIGVNR